MLSGNMERQRFSWMLALRRWYLFSCESWSKAQLVGALEQVIFAQPEQALRHQTLRYVRLVGTVLQVPQS